MVDVHTKKEFEILERLCSYTFSLSNYFHEGIRNLSSLSFPFLFADHQKQSMTTTKGQKKLAALEPLLRSTMESLVKAHSDYIEGRGQLDVDQVCLSLSLAFHTPFFLSSDTKIIKDPRKTT